MGVDIIKNLHFYDGTQWWNNGVDGGQPYSWVSHYVRGVSNLANTNEVCYKISQSFVINDEVYDGRVWSAGVKESYAGNVFNGKNRFVISLVKPNLESVSLYDGTFSGEQSGGQTFLWGDSITSHLSQQGNYKFYLELYTQSSKNTTQYEVNVSNPYTDWSVGDFERYDSDNNIRLISYDSNVNERYAIAGKTFQVGGIPHTATISLWAKGFRFNAEGKSLLSVSLLKPNSDRVVLWSGTLENDVWTNILGYVDIKAQFNQVGTYELLLEGWVKSVWIPEEDPPPPGWWVQSHVHYGSCSLNVQWQVDEYKQSKGDYDWATIAIWVKKYKTVFEVLGGKETPQKKIPKSAKEDVRLSESFSSWFGRTKLLSEVVKLGEGFLKLVKKTIQESLGMKEFYFPHSEFMKELAESIGLSEFYSGLLIKGEVISELVKLVESLTAKKISGNKETIIHFEDPTQWDQKAKQQTKWIKTKVEVGN